MIAVVYVNNKRQEIMWYVAQHNNAQNQNKNFGRGGRGRGLGRVDRGDYRNDRGNKLITNKDCPFSKLLITETGHRPTQYTKIVDTLPILCVDKNYEVLNNVIWKKIDLVETDFITTYPDANRWSKTHHMEIEIVNQNITHDAVTSLCPCTITMERRTHIFDSHLQKRLISIFERYSKNKSQEYFKFLANKKALIMIIFGQCNKTTKMEITLGTNYIAHRQAGRLIKFLNRLRIVYFCSYKSGLS